MLIIGLFAAFVLYIGLYLFWTVAQTHVSVPTAFVMKFNEMMLMPGETVFVIFRGLILCTAFYVAADFVASYLRRKRRAAKLEEQDGARSNSKTDKSPGLKISGASLPGDGAASSTPAIHDTPAIHESWLRRRTSRNSAPRNQAPQNQAPQNQAPRN